MNGWCEKFALRIPVHSRAELTETVPEHVGLGRDPAALVRDSAAKRVALTPVM